MKIRNLLIAGSLMMAALPSLASDYPEKLYLVGTMNNWTLPANGNLVEVPAVEDGLYSISMDIKADEYDTPIAFKIFNTLSDNWMDGSEYYGAMMPDNNCAIYKDMPASWRLAAGYGSSDMRIPNVKALSDAVITINLRDSTASIASSSVPSAPKEVYIADGGEDGVKHPLQRVGDSAIYTDSISLAPGAHRLAFTGDNGFLLGSTGSTYYLWKDRPANYVMIMDSHDPFIVSNWIGGKLEVSVNIANGYVSFTAPDQPAFPDTLNLVMKGENGEETKFPMAVYESEYGDRSFSCFLQDWQKEMRFVIEVPGAGTLKTDSDPFELWRSEHRYVYVDPYYSRDIEVSNWDGGDISVLVPESFSFISLYSSTQPLPKQNLYLIGTPQNWDINDGSMELTQVDNSLFLGEFEMGADPIFRFYTSLGDWNEGSLGSQYDDAPVEVTLNPEEELNERMVYGKGSWSFAGFPGGKMYMEVNLRSLSVIFSTQPISEVAKIESEQVTLNAVKGGIEVIAPAGYETVVFDLTGKIAGKGIGSCRISLLPGIYIANNMKVMVL